MLGGGVDAATLVAALGAGPPPPECRWDRPQKASLSRQHISLRVCGGFKVDESRMQPDAIGSAFRYSVLVIWTRFLCGSEKASR